MLYLGDCLEVMRGMTSESVQFVVTSPPYNIKNSSGGGFPKTSGKWKASDLDSGYHTHRDRMPHDEYVAWQRDCLLEMMRLIKPDGAIFYNHTWRVQKGLLQDRSDIVSGFPVRQIIIWHRSGGFNFNAGYFVPNYEVIYLIAKPDFKLAPKANGLGCVWRINQERGNKHPAAFPVELALQCIKSVGKGPVFDPFMGSGTTAVAAEKFGIKWIGIEISAEYAKMASERISNARKDAQ